MHRLLLHLQAMCVGFLWILLRGPLFHGGACGVLTSNMALTDFYIFIYLFILLNFCRHTKILIMMSLISLKKTQQNKYNNIKK
jgi:hypothetical protein